jgi:Na+/phosphate symporter
MIAEKVVFMMRGTFDAFARQDERSAVAVYEQDNSIDKKHKELLKQTAKEMSDQKHDMQAWFDVLWAIRSLERIGDRCKNLCEYVLFLTYGKKAHEISSQEKNLLFCYCDHILMLYHTDVSIMKLGHDYKFENPILLQSSLCSFHRHGAHIPCFQ